MRSPFLMVPVLAAMVALGAGCASSGARPVRAMEASTVFSGQRVTEHRDRDDLLTAGLGLAGLQSPAPPAFAEAERPTPAELRRRAIWSNWRGIADLAPNGGYGSAYGSVQAVPGREFHAFAKVRGATHPHRVLVQLPDAFDTAKRCVVVAASSGSRGVYGAIAVAAPWALPKGCAVAYTDKGAGTDFYDLDARTGFAGDGTISPEATAFTPQADGAGGVAFKHAHSQDNPEADWGRHVRQAAEYALRVLDEAHPQAAPFTFANTRIIAAGISNGGGAVLRAAELEGGWLDAVVAGEPNVYAAGEGGRPLYDVVTEAALLMPCALLHLPPEALPQPPLRAQAQALWEARCAALRERDLLQGADPKALAKDAYDRMRATGWTDGALRGGATSVGFDLWRAVAVAYASAHGRYAPGAHPCGYRYAAQHHDTTPRAANAAERAAWWSDSSGIPPGNGLGIVDPSLAPPDFGLSGLQCLRRLWEGEGDDTRRVQAGVRETRARLSREGLPVIVLHGLDDGLVPPAFGTAPYVRASQAAGRDVRYWQVERAQHFDAFLAFPDYAGRFVPLLPYVYAALDRVWAHLEDGAPLPADMRIAPKPRGTEPMRMDDLRIP